MSEVHRPITRENMFEPLLEADPTFQSRWNKFLAEWHNEAELPCYIALTEFAYHLISHLEAENRAALDRVFDVVERWQVDGDNYVKEAAVIGLLEDLQNENLHQSTRPSQFESWLRPESKRAWDQLNRMWAGKSP